MKSSRYLFRILLQGGHSIDLAFQDKEKALEAKGKFISVYIESDIVLSKLVDFGDYCLKLSQVLGLEIVPEDISREQHVAVLEKLIDKIEDGDDWKKKKKEPWAEDDFE